MSRSASLWRGIRSPLPLTLMAVAVQAGAQLPDATVEDLLEEEINEQVEQELTESLEEQVQAEIEAGVADTIENEIEASVSETVESEIEASVAETVAETVESAIESTVVESLETLIESSVSDTVEDAVESGLISEIEETVENSVGNVVEEVLDAVDDGLATAEGTSEEADTASAERFEGVVDAAGRRVEREVWVVYVPSDYADRIPDWGFTVRERRDLGAFNRVILRVDAPEDRDIAEAALELALDAPGTRVDFNHVYEPSDGDTDSSGPAVDGPVLWQDESTDRRSQRPCTGMIDSAVAADHPALSGIHFEQRDFVTVANARPAAHGTAVASVLAGAGSSGQHRAIEEICVASVFFEDGSGEVVTTTVGLAAALDWLAGRSGLRVINMSLSGPPNAVLEAAIEDVTEKDIVVVAAVGNNGPVGEPLYPAAYPSVVGVTAVDAEHRIYRYAGRGPHVTFAAPGVGVRVADPDSGSYTVRSGTSMAAPHVAMLLASELSNPAKSAAGVLRALERSALDLGPRNYDEIFGFGLVQAVRRSP